MFSCLLRPSTVCSIIEWVETTTSHYYVCVPGTLWYYCSPGNAVKLVDQSTAVDSNYHADYRTVFACWGPL